MTSRISGAAPRPGGVALRIGLHAAPPVEDAHPGRPPVTPPADG